RYISTVDSGNLAGHLLTLRPGLLALVDEPLYDARLLQGLDDTFALLHEAMLARDDDATALDALRRALDAARASPPQTLAAAAACMQHLLDCAEAVPLDAEPGSDTDLWLQALREQCRDASATLRPFAAWTPPATQAKPCPIPTLRQLADSSAQSMPDTDHLHDQAAAHGAQQHAAVLIQTIERLAQQAGALALMDYGFLYDSQRDLLSIGYNVDERRLDAGFYDLLASEARLTNYVAIAQEQLPQDSWFALGRLLTSGGGEPVLLSWSGSMFEYLMPLLVMPNYAGTLLDQTCR
ncbi:glycosyltransferase 36, partial [mine drainage metagenome]